MNCPSKGICFWSVSSTAYLVKLDCGYRLDLVVGKLVVVEFKAIETIEPIHEAQLVTYLRLLNLWLGLLINFNVPVLKNGIRRIVNG